MPAGAARAHAADADALARTPPGAFGDGAVDTAVPALALARRVHALAVRGARIRAHSLLAAIAAPPERALARAIIARAVLSAAAGTCSEVAARAVPVWRAVAGAVAAETALAAPACALTLGTRCASPPLVALALVRRAARAMPRAAAWADAHLARRPAPFSLALASARHAPATMRALVWTREQSTGLASEPREAVARAWDRGGGAPNIR